MIILLAAERKTEEGREKRLMKSDTFLRKTLSKSEQTEGNVFNLTKAFYENVSNYRMVKY